jgi:fatty-acyl-CoA synthase
MRTFVDVLRDNASPPGPLRDVHARQPVKSASSATRTSGSRPDAAATRSAGSGAPSRGPGRPRPARARRVRAHVHGALTAGIVAVPIYPPQTLAKLEAYGDTVRHVLAASGAEVLVTNEALRP